MEEKMKEYRDYLVKKEVAESTKEIYMRAAGRLNNYRRNRSVTKELMVEYKDYISELGYATATQNQHIAAINHYAKFLGCTDCSVKAKRMQGRQSLEDVLTIEEYKSLLAYAREIGNEKYYMIMRTLATTGIRVGELSYFTVEILDRKSIQVTNKKKTREICLPESLKKELTAYCSKTGIRSGPIFLGNRKTAISRVAVYNMLVHLAEKTGVPKEKAHPHNFRHLFAVTYMEHYSNLFELADLLGHSSLETTRIYTRSSISEKGRRIDELGL